MLPIAFDVPQMPANPHSDQRIASPSNPSPNPGVTSLGEYFEIIERYARSAPWYFRGEHQKYEIPGLPKFARDYYPRGDGPPLKDVDTLELLIDPQSSGNGLLVYPSCMTKQEVEIIEDFKKAPPDDEFFHAVGGTTHQNAGWLSLAQHYGQPTRLLDISSDPLVALYFACQGGASSDGYVWLYPMPPSMHEETPEYRETFNIGTGVAAQQGIDFFSQNRLHEYYPSQEWPPLNLSFLLNIHSPNSRIIAQRGAFLWSPKPLMPLTRNGFNVLINRDAKSDLLSVLCSFGINEVGLKLG